MPRKDIPVGTRFGMLTVEKELPRRTFGRSNTKARMFLVKCDCGNEKEVRGTCLLSGTTTSCGCLHRKQLSQRNTTHGKSNTRLFQIWKGMVSRCRYDYHSNRHYRGKGIRVCAEWLNDFTAFSKWATENGYNDLLSIDRINGNGNYEPSNCRWIPRAEQMLNISTNRRITAFGKTQTLAEWSRETGIDRRIIGNRIDRLHWTPEKALSTTNKGKHK